MEMKIPVRDIQDILVKYKSKRQGKLREREGERMNNCGSAHMGTPITQ